MCNEIGFHDAEREYYDDFLPSLWDERDDDDRSYDRYLAECESLGLDPNSPLARYIIDNVGWDFVPAPTYVPSIPYSDIVSTEEDIPF